MNDVRLNFLIDENIKLTEENTKLERKYANSERAVKEVEEENAKLKEEIVCLKKSRAQARKENQLGKTVEELNSSLKLFKECQEELNKSQAAKSDKETKEKQKFLRKNVNLSSWQKTLKAYKRQIGVFDQILAKSLNAAELLEAVEKIHQLTMSESELTEKLMISKDTIDRRDKKIKKLQAKIEEIKSKESETLQNVEPEERPIDLKDDFQDFLKDEEVPTIGEPVTEHARNKIRARHNKIRKEKKSLASELIHVRASRDNYKEKFLTLKEDYDKHSTLVDGLLGTNQSGDLVSVELIEQVYGLYAEKCTQLNEANKKFNELRMNKRSKINALP